MACLRLGSKSEAFHRDGQTWVCTTELPSDITIEVGDMSFQLHKFPLLSRSGLLEKLIEDSNSDHHDQEASSTPSSFLQLHDLPGGAKAFELVAKFCYGVKTELSSSNSVALRCASEYLQMTEDFGEGNLISLTEAFLNDIFTNWSDSLKALETCEEVQSFAEDLHIVSRCIDSLATKACSDPSLLINWPAPPDQNDVKTPKTTALWNGILCAHHDNQTKPPIPSGEEWWFDDLSFLSLPLYKRLISAIEVRGVVKPETISASIIHYAKKYLPLMNTQTSLNDFNYVNTGAPISEADQRNLLEGIVGLIPNKKGVTSSKVLLRLLRVAMVLHASPSCRENLEKIIGAQLDQVLLVDLLVPNMVYSVETLYDIDCVQRILDHFMAVEEAMLGDQDQGQVVSSSTSAVAANDTMTPVTMVANLVDGYLAEVAVDVNLKLPKFQALATVIPDYARPVDDGIYKAIDVYLKAHPWLADSEREQLCRLMNCQKLSLEASTHAAQNERLPLRVIVQVVFLEQLRLRASISSWFFVSGNLENSQPALPNGISNLNNNGLIPKGDASQDFQRVNDGDMSLRVSEIEKECSNMRRELQKLAKTKKSSWTLLPKRFCFRKKSQPIISVNGQSKESKVNGRVGVAQDHHDHQSALEGKVENHENGDVAAH